MHFHCQTENSLLHEINMNDYYQYREIWLKNGITSAKDVIKKTPINNKLHMNSFDQWAANTRKQKHIGESRTPDWYRALQRQLCGFYTTNIYKHLPLRTINLNQQIIEPKVTTDTPEIELWTDGSKTDQLTIGAGIVITEKEELQPSTKVITNKSFKVPEGNTSSTKPELYAIRQALHITEKTSKR